MSKTLFIGLGSTPPSWYRCALPAHILEADWWGLYPVQQDADILGAPYAGNMSAKPVFEDYDCIIIQQPRGEWINIIKGWQKQGIKVIYEIDDFVHGIHKMQEHSNRKWFSKKFIRSMVECMRQCDGMIVSTDYLAIQYRKYNPNIHVCRLGLDMGRYIKIQHPPREEIVIGWAGGTGHHKAIGTWLIEILKVCQLFDNVRFASLGTEYAQIINLHTDNKGIIIPWVSLENFPYALTNFDINIAPAHESKYFQSKSDLRWLESSALGIPTIADPSVYYEIEDGVTGVFAVSDAHFADELHELIDNEAKRKMIGKQAQDYVVQHRDISVMAKQWETAIEAITSEGKVKQTI